MSEKVTRSRRNGKEIRLLEEEVAHVGVDTHKRSYQVAVWRERQGDIVKWTQPADPELLCERLRPIRERIGRVVYEAGPTGYSLYRTLTANGFRAAVVAPSRTPRAPGRSAKSDRRDAAKLAFLESKQMLQAVYVPTPQEEADRQVFRRRDQLTADSRRAKHRISSFLLQHGIAEPEGLANWSNAAVEALRQIELAPELRICLDLLVGDLDHANAQVKSVNRALVELARTERHEVAVTLLRRVRGVGLLTALAFRTELPKPRRLATGEKVAAYLGLAPWTAQSGETSRSGPMMKAGNRRLRTLLVEVAWQWKRYDPAADAIYKRLLVNTGSGKKAICGVARHLAILLWRIATTGELYGAGPPDAQEPANVATDA